MHVPGYDPEPILPARVIAAHAAFERAQRAYDGPYDIAWEWRHNDGHRYVAAARDRRLDVSPWAVVTAEFAEFAEAVGKEFTRLLPAGFATALRAGR